ncbi:MAG: glycosyltransferase family 39 protein [Anaerolineae bacterium]|nr:glycosyltransferase family 39 protein [Anaerolineae bacterium]
MNKHTLVLIAILALATFLRFWNLDATEFKYDEATVCNLAAHFIDTGIPPARGMGSSVGIDNPPMMIYLMSLPVLFSRDPLVASGFVALLNVIGVWGCYALGKRYWNHQVGLLAALLLSISPWAIFYSRKVWAQNVLLPFVLLYFAFLLAWLVEGRKWALSGAIVTLAALTQIHFATLAFAPMLALLVSIALLQQVRRRARAGNSDWHPATQRRTPLWKPLLVGIGASLSLYTPYLALDAFIGWRNTHAFVAMLRNPARMQWETLRFALLNVGGREIHALAGAEKFELWLSSILDLNYWPDRIQEVGVVLGFIYLLVRLWVDRQNKRAFARNAVLVLWLLSPVLFYLRSQTDVFPHYLIPLYPAPYLALAILVIDAGQWMVRQSKKQAKPAYTHVAQVAGGICLALLVIWQSTLSLSIHAFVDTHHTPGGMGTPIRIYRDVVGVIERNVQAWNNDQVVVLCPGDQPRWDACPAVFTFLAGRSFDIRLADYDKTLVFPQSSADTLILLTPGESLAQTELPRYAEELVQERISLRENIGMFQFYRLPADYKPLPPVQPEKTPVRLENGISLSGYELLSALEQGQTTHLALYWHIDDVPTVPPAQGYSLTTNIVGPDGQRYGQKDGDGQRVGLWRAGDTLISWFDIALSADAPLEPLHLRVGMYIHTPPDQFTTIHVVGENGEPVAAAVTWPLE